MAPPSAYEDFAEMGRGALVDYLALRGLSTSARKIELVALAYSAFVSNAPIIYTQEEISTNLKKEYAEKLKRHNIKKDPLSVTSDCLVDDVTKWPSVDLGKIFSYILKLKEFDAEYVGKYKDQKGYSYYQSGFVGTIWYFYSKEISINLCFLFCKVTPSQSVRDERELWVAIDKVTMDICTAWCSCIAGTGECCNRVIATLYKLEYAVSNLFTDPACTSMPCGWNKGTFSISGSGKIKGLVKLKKTTLLAMI